MASLVLHAARRGNRPPRGGAWPPVPRSQGQRSFVPHEQQQCTGESAPRAQGFRGTKATSITVREMFKGGRLQDCGHLQMCKLKHEDFHFVSGCHKSEREGLSLLTQNQRCSVCISTTSANASSPYKSSGISSPITETLPPLDSFSKRAWRGEF